MSEIRILCVGKIKEKYFQEGMNAFLKIIRGKYPASVIECPDEPTPARASQVVEKKIKDIEGERILSYISREDYVIALCIDGKQWSSGEFARRLQRRMKTLDKTGGSCVFIIGGSLGLSDQVIRRADEKLSFSSMTFPHQMMRMILCEQIACALGSQVESWK